MQLRGNKAIVTGGSRGIGLAIAKELVQSGAMVVISGRNKETLDAAAKESGAIPVVWDVGDISIMQTKFEECVALLGGFDILVNNAGVFDKVGWGMGMLNVTEDDWDRVMDINLKAAFFMMQTAAKYMLAHGIKGNILNVSSVAANEPLQGPYGASKAGLFGLTRGWGKVMAPTGIVLNGIAPGSVNTEMNDWHEGDSLAHDRIPTGRFILSEEIAKLARYYADISLGMIKYMMCVFENMEFADKLGVESLYDVVRAGDWTLDKMKSLTSDVYSDLNGNGQYDREDLFLSPVQMSSKRLGEYMANQVPLLFAESRLPCFLTFDGTVEGDIFTRSGHKNFGEASRNFYNKPVHNLLVFEWQHAAGDFEKVLNGGFVQIQKEIGDSLAAHAGDTRAVEYLNALSAFCDAAVQWSHKCADAALALAETTENAAYQRNLRLLSETLHKVPEHPAENFYEAILSLAMVYPYLPDSIGLIDRYLYPFYRKAKADPDSYRNLRVRVSGFSEYFVTLNTALQDEILARTPHDR